MRQKSSSHQVTLLHTYRSVIPILISAATLLNWNAFVSTENMTTVTEASLYAWLLTYVARACRVLTAWLGAGIAAWFIVTARWTCKSCRGKNVG